MALLNKIAQETGALLWRLAVYFAILIGAFWLLSKGYSWATHALGVQFAKGPNTRPAEAVAFGQARLLIAAIVAWTVTAWLGRDRLAPMLPFRPKSGQYLLQGTLWGFAASAATIGAIAAFGGYRVSGIALSGSGLLYYALLWLVIAVLTGLAENLALLGYPLFRTERATGWIAAMILGSILFAAAHLGNPGENPLGIASVFLTALVMAMTVWLTGDLWLSVGIHAGIIVAEDLVFSVPDSGAFYTGGLLIGHLTGPAWLSGGDAGPEGSLLAFPISVILLLILWRVYRRPTSEQTAAAAA
jgi:membrane protease YdiL (CAAX protease family)